MIHGLRALLDNFLKENNLWNSQKKYNIELSKNFIHGNFSTNIALVFGGKKKDQIGELISLKLKEITWIEKIEYVSPGFINIFIKSEILNNLNESWAKIKEKKNINISLEYGSPNPTGPCHIGHTRGSLTGQILGNILEYGGYNLRRDCIFNDGGQQVEKFIESIYIRYLELNNLATEEDLKNIFYKGLYVKDLAKLFLKEKEKNLTYFQNQKETIMKIMEKNMKEDLALIGIKHHTITKESHLFLDKEVCWNLLKELDLLEIEKKEEGTKIFFKSKDFEDDKDRVVERENKTLTYFGNDIIYHYKKQNHLSEEKFNKQIIILGDDHVGYLKRLLGAVKTFNIDLVVITHNLVKITKNGVEVKMSKRNGNFLTIRDFIEKNQPNGADILKVLIMSYGYTSPIHLNLDKLNLEESPLFYIQYAYARLSSIFEKQTYNGKELNLSLLDKPEEKQIISYLVFWPNLIELICSNLDIHCFFLYFYEFSQLLHAYFSKYTILNKEDSSLTNNRLYLMSHCYNLIEIIGSIIQINLYKTI